VEKSANLNWGASVPPGLTGLSVPIFFARRQAKKDFHFYPLRGSRPDVSPFVALRAYNSITGFQAFRAANLRFDKTANFKVVWQAKLVSQN
jgi:hypothetical protein